MEREKHWRARKIKEAVLINATNPTKDVRNGGAMNLEKGYEMDPIWSGFNEGFREMLNKKVREVDAMFSVFHIFLCATNKGVGISIFSVTRYLMHFVFSSCFFQFGFQ